MEKYYSMCAIILLRIQILINGIEGLIYKWYLFISYYLFSPGTNLRSIDIPLELKTGIGTYRHEICISMYIDTNIYFS